MAKQNFKIIIFILGIALLTGGAFWVLKKQGINSNNSNNQNQPSENQSTPFFKVKAVYFTETEDPTNVLLNIEVEQNKITPTGYTIYFPPQTGTSQGIGPIEVGGKLSPSEFKKEVTTISQATLQEFVARSHPDNVPEFGKNYFCKINFYLTNGQEYKWEDQVGWGKTNQSQAK